MLAAEEGTKIVIRHHREIMLDLGGASADRVSGFQCGSPQIGIELVHATHVGGAPAYQIDIGLPCIGKTIAFDPE